MASSSDAPNTPHAHTNTRTGQRRPHTKSSTGCTQCKDRRVKCDEARPSCTRCSKRNASCSYLSQVSDNTASNSPIVSSVQSSPITSEFEDENTRALELKLMHQYLTSTSIVLAQNSTDVTFYIHVTIKYALSNPFLLDAILATAAIHLSTVEPDKTQFWIRTALQYHNRAITGLNDALKDPLSSNSDALSLSSMCMVTNCLSLSCKRLGGEEVDAVTELIGTRKLLGGVILCLNQTIIGAGGLWNGSFEIWRDQQLSNSLNPNDTVSKNFITHLDSTNPIPGHLGVFFSQFSNFAEYRVKNDEFYHTTVRRMKEMATCIESLTSEYKEDYQHSCTLLLGAMDMLQSNRGIIIAWPTLINEFMVTLLQTGDNIASLIFLHYGVALYLSTLHCFSKGAGRHLVETLSTALEAKCPEWIEVLNWARASVLRDM
ncbi:hypothetical protein EAF04_010395 [Stromatinia cepivora]|nr:hypothetical protein EAF04_010395 [Stromatinia cepivora]